jgi:hypothetical protein
MAAPGSRELAFIMEGDIYVSKSLLFFFKKLPVLPKILLFCQN